MYHLSAAETARELGLPVEGAAVAKRYFTESRERGEADLGTQAMYKVLERRIGKGDAR